MEPARLDSRCRCLGDAAGKMTPRCARKPEPRGHEPRTTSWAPGVTEGRRQLRAWRRVTGPRNQRPPASPVLTDVPSPGRAALRRRIALCALLRVRLRAAADEQQLRAHEATSVARPVPKRPGPGSEEGFAVASQRGRRRGGAMWGPGQRETDRVGADGGEVRPRPEVWRHGDAWGDRAGRGVTRRRDESLNAATAARPNVSNRSEQWTRLTQRPGLCARRAVRTAKAPRLGTWTRGREGGSAGLRGPLGADTLRGHPGRDRDAMPAAEPLAQRRVPGTGLRRGREI